MSCSYEPVERDRLEQSQERPPAETTVPEMGTTSVIYRILLVLHIAAAFVGFGGVIAHGAYNAKAFAAKAGEASLLLRTTKSVTAIAYNSINGVLVLGIVLIALSDGAWKFSAPWVSAAFVVWFALVGVMHGLIRPSAVGLAERADALDPEMQMAEDPEVNTLAKKLALGEGLFQLLVVVALVVMVWGPAAWN